MYIYVYTHSRAATRCYIAVSSSPKSPPHELLHYTHTFKHTFIHMHTHTHTRSHIFIYVYICMCIYRVTRIILQQHAAASPCPPPQDLLPTNSCVTHSHFNVCTYTRTHIQWRSNALLHRRVLIPKVSSPQNPA